MIFLKLAPTITANGQAAEAVTDTQNLNTAEQLVASVSDEKVKDSEFDTEMMLNSFCDENSERTAFKALPNSPTFENTDSYSGKTCSKTVMIFLLKSPVVPTR